MSSDDVLNFNTSTPPVLTSSRAWTGFPLHRSQKLFTHMKPLYDSLMLLARKRTRRPAYPYPASRP